MTQPKGRNAPAPRSPPSAMSPLTTPSTRAPVPPLPSPESRTCPACGARGLEASFEYFAPPAGETRFASLSGVAYHRRYDRCPHCGHFVGTQIDAPALYTGEYVASTYGSRDGLRARFAAVAGLPPERSDNRARAERVHRFASARLGASRRALLDIGAGLGVFPAAMRAMGWRCTALDPDPVATAHLREDLGLETVHGLFDRSAVAGPFDLVTLNKVIEHVPDPVTLVREALAVVAPGGCLYLEVPDGDAAMRDGPEREEFFVDHPHVFSPRSLAVVIERAGAILGDEGRLCEPSGKFTCFAFAAPRTLA